MVSLLVGKSKWVGWKISISISWFFLFHFSFFLLYLHLLLPLLSSSLSPVFFFLFFTHL